MIKRNPVYDVRGRTAEEIRADAVLESRSWAPKLTAREQRDYNVCAAMADEALPAGAQKSKEGGLFREISGEIEKNLPQNIVRHGGSLYFNMRKLVQRLQPALVSDVSGSGQELAFLQPMEFIELLRNAMVVRKLGAQVLSNLVGNIAFPRQTAAGELTWTAEGAGSDIDDTALSLDQLVMTPKTAMSTSAYSRQLLRQSSIDVQNMVEQDLAFVNALGIDAAAIKGGGDKEPVGILETEGVTTVDLGEEGAIPTFGSLLDLLTAVEGANVPIVRGGYLATPAIRGKLKQTPVVGTYPTMIWQATRPEELMGFPAFASNQVPKDLVKGSPPTTDLHAIIFGSWEQLIIGEWGVLELLVDPYRLKKQGVIEVTSFMMADVGLRHPEAFAVIRDARLTEPD
jgi:HK97 family phage major capsid protein